MGKDMIHIIYTALFLCLAGVGCGTIEAVDNADDALECYDGEIPFSEACPILWRMVIDYQCACGRKYVCDYNDAEAVEYCAYWDDLEDRCTTTDPDDHCLEGIEESDCDNSDVANYISFC